MIAAADGTRLGEDVAAVLGTPSNPMTRDQVVAKCRDLMAPILGNQTQLLIVHVLHIEKTKDVRELRPLLQRKLSTGPPKLSEYPKS